MNTGQRRTVRAGPQGAIAQGIKSAAAAPSLPELVRDHLGRQLQSVYASVTADEHPQRLLDLIAQLGSVLAAHDTRAASAFRNDLLAALPGLRVFAMSLVYDPTRADDLGACRKDFWPRKLSSQHGRYPIQWADAGPVKPIRYPPRSGEQGGVLRYPEMIFSVTKRLRQALRARPLPELPGIEPLIRSPLQSLACE